MILQELIGGFTFFKTREDDDVIDRLHYFVTTNLLIALAMLVSFKQFGGKPIECMTPDSFPGAWEQYAENYCWAQDTYFMAFTEKEVPREEDLRHRNRVSYYQWVPFCLIIEALCFWLPSIIWRSLSEHSGMRVDDLVRMAVDNNNIKPDIRKNTIRILTVHLENALKFHKRAEKRNILPHKYLRCLNAPYTACYVTLIYLLMKAVFLCNVLLQFFYLNDFMIRSGPKQKGEYDYYGLGALFDLLNGTTWQTSGMFPRVTLCDFQVRAMGSNVQNFTIQCVLVINLFNEKIFVFLWFWFAILTVLTFGNFLYWALLLTIPCFSRWYIARHLELSDMPFSRHDPDSLRLIHRFVHKYLRTDGMFIIRMVTMHTSIIFGTDLVQALWKSFYGLDEKLPPKPEKSHSNIAAKSMASLVGIVEKLGGIRNRKNGKGRKDPDQLPVLGGMEGVTVEKMPVIKSLNDVDSANKISSQLNQKLQPQEQHPTPLSDSGRGTTTTPSGNKRHMDPKQPDTNSTEVSDDDDAERLWYPKKPSTSGNKPLATTGGPRILPSAPDEIDAGGPPQPFKTPDVQNRRTLI